MKLNYAFKQCTNIDHAFIVSLAKEKCPLKLSVFGFCSQSDVANEAFTNSKPPVTLLAVYKNHSVEMEAINY
jgi:hypothetical protein